MEITTLELQEDYNKINPSKEFVEKFVSEVKKEFIWFSKSDIKLALLHTTLLHDSLLDESGEYFFDDDFESYEEWLEFQLRNSFIAYYERTYDYTYPKYLYEEYLKAAKKFYKNNRKKDKVTSK